MLSYLRNKVQHLGRPMAVVVVSLALLSGLVAPAATASVPAAPVTVNAAAMTAPTALPGLTVPTGVKEWLKNKLWQPLIVKNGGTKSMTVCDNWTKTTSTWDSACRGKSQTVKSGKSSNFGTGKNNDTDAIFIPKDHKLQVLAIVSGRRVFGDFTTCQRAKVWKKVAPLPPGDLTGKNRPATREFRVVKC